MKIFLKRACQRLVVPVLLALYAGAIVPLRLRQFFHLVVYEMDWLFDQLATAAGHNSGKWSLPAASDEPLPILRPDGGITTLRDGIEPAWQLVGYVFWFGLAMLLVMGARTAFHLFWYGTT